MFVFGYFLCLEYFNFIFLICCESLFRSKTWLKLEKYILLEKLVYSRKVDGDEEMKDSRFIIKNIETTKSEYYSIHFDSLHRQNNEVNE